MIESEESNNFKFTLQQGDVLLSERIFDANKFNPFTRKSVNIKYLLPSITLQLQRVLSKREYDTRVWVGEGWLYDNHTRVERFINSFPKSNRNELTYNPEPSVIHLERDVNRGLDAKTIKGVECKLGFYISDKVIVERTFYVDRFNPMARYSYDVTQQVDYIMEDIINEIKKNDMRYMFEENKGY